MYTGAAYAASPGVGGMYGMSQTGKEGGNQVAGQQPGGYGYSASGSYTGGMSNIDAALNQSHAYQPPTRGATDTTAGQPGTTTTPTTGGGPASGPGGGPAPGGGGGGGISGGNGTPIGGPGRPGSGSGTGGQPGSGYGAGKQQGALSAYPGIYGRMGY